MNEEKIKHLEFIESNITRMNSCSFQLKGWMLTVDMALLALYASSGVADDSVVKRNAIYILIAIFPTIIFWFLDSFYLQQERKFRAIYNDVAEITDEEERQDVKLFEMPLEKYKSKKCKFWYVFKSKAMIWLYLPIIVGLAIASYVLW